MKERITAFRVYKDGNVLMGIADVTLPNIESMTDTVKGAGIAGEIDSPSIGLFGSMTLGFTWRTITKEAAELMKPGLQSLDIRGNIQEFVETSGTYKQVPLKVVVKGLPKKLEGGKLEQNAAMDAPQEFEVVYYKKTLDGRDLIEIDKLNYVYKVLGQDQLQQVRRNLGM